MSNDNRHGDERVEMIADMLDRSMSQAEVARRLGISRARVGQIATAHSLQRTTGRTQQPLSQLQARILSFLRAFATDHQYPPQHQGSGCGMQPKQHCRGLVQSVPLGREGVPPAGARHRKRIGLD